MNTLMNPFYISHTVTVHGIYMNVAIKSTQLLKTANNFENNVSFQSRHMRKWTLLTKTI